VSNGLTFQVAYTWAHAIDNSSDPLSPSAGNQEFPRNSLDLAVERGNSDFDVRQRLVINHSWAPPVGPGHGHLAEGFAGKIFEGWVRSSCATANPVEIIVAQSEQGRGVLGVIDGSSPKGVEGDTDIVWRHDLLRKIGYKR
jgi:hypothetical protein